MELDRVQKAGKMDKENGKDKTSKAQTDDDADSDDEERPGLFEPKRDDKQAKAEKKRLYHKSDAKGKSTQF
jgi:hypothetical protein